MSKSKMDLSLFATTKNINEVRNSIPEFSRLVEQGYEKGILEPKDWREKIIDPNLCNANNDGVTHWQVSRYLGVIALYYSP